MLCELVLFMKHHWMKEIFRIKREDVNSYGAYVRITIKLCCATENPHRKKNACFMCFCQCLISVFLKKTHVAYLQFFLTFFDKRKSRKRCEEMLHLAGLKPVPPLRSCCISRCVVSDGCSGITVMPVSASVYACIRV